MKRSEFAGLDESESSLQDVIRLLRDGVLGVLLVSFLALFNSSAMGAVDVKTARLGTLPAKATVVTNVVGAVDSDEVLGIATNAIPLWARSETKPTYTASEVGARPNDWMPTAADVGAVAVGANGGVAIGYGTTASGNYSHAEGGGTTASGYYSHAEGSGTTASGHYSHAEGVYANANENYSFSWNGNKSTTYNSHGVGTFNLNPLGGLSGLWIGGSNLATILGGYAKRTGETETVDFRNARTLVKTQLAPLGEDAVNFDMLAGYASGIATTYVPTNALVSLNQSVQYVTADSNGSAVEILAPTNGMKDWVVYIYTTTNNAVLFPTGTVYAADATVTNALKPNVVTALYLSSYPAVTNGLIVGRQEMNPIVIVR